MKYPITESDKNLLLQHTINYKMRIYVEDNTKKIINVVEGVAEYGSTQISSDSDIRRTANFTLKLDDFVADIEKKVASWIGLYYEIQVGIQDQRTEQYVWFPNGIYRITGASTTYDATTNSLTFDLSDRISELDGTVNGQMTGAMTLSFPVIYNNVKRTIQQMVIYIMTYLTTVKNYIIDDIGEYYGMPQNNSDYLTYRKNNSEWNILPYDLEYEAGANVADVLTEIRDLYPSCQMYFDVYGNFCFNMTPTMDKELVELDDSYIQSIILSTDTEQVTYDIGAIKNITEVFGTTYDIDRYATSVSYASGCYTLTLSDYTEYKNHDIIAFVPSTDNTGECKIQINSLAQLPVYQEYTNLPLAAKDIESGQTCAVKIYTLDDEKSTKVAYYLGQYQPHALCVLTSDINDTVYNKDYFSKKYNVNEKNIVFREQPYSPFTVQKFGEVAESKSGDKFENIMSNTVAKVNASYYNRKSSTMMDTVTIQTKLIPFLDVNVKINYQKKQEGTAYSYIVTQVEHDFSSCTSTITMYRFLQLYE